MTFPDFDPKIGAQNGSGNRFEPYSKNPGMRVTLKADNQLTKKGTLDEPFVLPVPPLDTLQRSLTYEWSDYQTIAAGQFSRPTGMDLQTLAFDTILLADDYSWAFYNPLRTKGWDAAEQARQLGRIMRSGSPFWLLIEQARYKAAGTGLDFGSVPYLKMLASLRAITSASRNGEPEVLYVNLSFVEHRSAAITEKALSSGGGGGAGGPSRGGAATVVKGGASSSKVPASIPALATTNSLHDLATLYYGSASKWTVIKQANPWLGNITADHALNVWDTSELKAAGKANRRLTIPVLS